MKQNSDVHEATGRRLRSTEWLAFLLLAVPLVTASVAMIRTSFNVPLADDYGAVALFLLRYVHTHGVFSHISIILTFQFTQYKLILLNTITALQYHLLGHSNYRATQLLGNLSVPAVLLLLWLILARQRRPFQQTLWLILVPWYLFLGLSYYEALNWAVCDFAVVAVTPFAIASVFFFTSPIRYATLWGTFFLVLCIASSPSGFFLAIALLILLTYQRRLSAWAAVAITAGGMAALYSLHYQVLTARSPISHHLGGIAIFSLAFLGGIFVSVPLATVLGIVLVAGFVFLLARGWARLSPDTFCLALFCLITALIVAPLRIHEGLASAMSSRYQLFPLMLLSAEYLAILRIFVPQRLALRSRWSVAIALGTTAAIAFGLSSQAHAYRILHARQRLLLTHIILWERHPERLVATPDEPGYFYGDAHLTHRITAQEILAQSIASGLYLPPVTAQDPLPVKPHSPATLGIEDEPPPHN